MVGHGEMPTPAVPPRSVEASCHAQSFEGCQAVYDCSVCRKNGTDHTVGQEDWPYLDKPVKLGTPMIHRNS